MRSYFASLIPWRKMPRPSKEISVASDSTRLLSSARRALEEGQPERALLRMGFGEILAGDERVNYLLDASQLWWEFKHWRQAYALLLRAEDQAQLHIGPRAERIQHALLDLESTMALDHVVQHRAPEAGFWTCLVARRTRTVLDLPLEEAWQELQSSVSLELAPSRALEAVQVVAMAHFCGLKVGSLEAAAAYVSHAPRSLKVLCALRSFVQSLLGWERLYPVTLPWLGVLEVVVEKPAGE